MLDVSGAYDNVSHDRLLHNLKKRRLRHFVPWVKAFLTNRSTRIRMPEGMSAISPTPTGIPQGSPISPILYLIYNADLLACCGAGVTSNGWVDDVGFIAKKYALIYFVNTKEVDLQYTSLTLRGHTVTATRTAERYLGYWLDPGLEFRHHREKAVAKASVSLQALRSSAGSTWGASLYAMRRIYLLLGVLAWKQPMLISKSKARNM